MLWLVFSSFFCFYLNSFASFEIKTQIYDIDFGGPQEELLILLKSGHVTRLKSHDPKLIDSLKIALKKKSWLKFQLNERSELDHFELVQEKVFKPLNFDSPDEEIYEPTVIENMDLARKYFQEARYKEKESQCYNRAQIWTYEWFAKNLIYSNKTWLFFTRKYIRKYKFDWWFHVSPSVKVIEDGVLREKIMDAKYARGPLDLKNWTDIFLKNNANCPLVGTYSDYANYPETGWCFTMRSSMFYYQPFDLEMKETWGSLKSNWIPEEIKQAYLEAFDEVF